MCLYVPMISRAFRSWLNSRGVATVAIVAFAIGIGAATAMYTIVDSVLLRPLPYAAGERFIALYGASTSEPDRFSSSTSVDLQEYRRRATSFDVFGIFTPSTHNLTAPGEPRHVMVVSVTPGLVPALGIEPALGHWFTDGQGAAIAETLWRQLGADPQIVGKPITLDGRVYTVAAVMPARFVLPVSGPGAEGVATDVWIQLAPDADGADATGAFYFAYARRKPGVPLAAAQAEVKTIAADIARRDPQGHAFYSARVDDLRDVGIREQRPTILLLLTAAVVLLVITCANVAGLLLVRSVSRARETATRIALGASARQLALQYLIEGALVSAIGALVGIGVSAVLVRWALAFGSDFLPRTSVVSMDWTVPGLAFGLGAFTSVVSTLAPLWQASRAAPADVLNPGVRVSAGARVKRLSQALVVAEIALAFALVAGAAGLALHLRALANTPPGFDPDHLLAFAVDVPAPIAAAKAPIRNAYQTHLVDAIAALPGATGAGFSNQLALDGCCLSTTIEREGHPSGSAERTSFVIASPEYLMTMRIPLRRGRLLTDRDTSEAPVSVMLNQAAATRYWGDDNPVGQFGVLAGGGSRFQVVGVVGDVKNNGLDSETVPEVYLPSAVTFSNPMKFVVRSTLPADTLLAQIRAAVRSVDPALPIHDVTTMTAVVARSLATERVSAALSSGFALTALLLATLGIYGLVSYTVRQQTVEIGTRMAVGATSRDILRLVAGNGLIVAAIGVGIGGVLILAGSTLLDRLISLQPISWISAAASAFVVAAVAGCAAALPALRASRMQPNLAIRDEAPPGWRAARAHVGRIAGSLTAIFAPAADVREISESELLRGFVDAARQAATPADAMRAALDTVRRQIGATSALLLEKRGDGAFTCTTASPASSRPAGAIPEFGWLAARTARYSSALPLSAGDLEAIGAWAAGQRPERSPEIEWLASHEVRAAVALRARHETIGFLLIGPGSARDMYTDAERRVLGACGPQFALMIENARLTSRVVEQEKVRRDLALAAEVQKRLLPESPPESEAASLAAVSVPARFVGGDYFDFIDAGDHQIGVALADIAGKGIPAALIMSSVRMSLRILASEAGVSLPQLAARMNRFLFQATASNSYATFFYARVDDRTRELRYVNAGHLPPLLLRAGEVQELTEGGSVIGMFDGLSYDEGSVALEAGDVLVAFTDGVPEAQNPNQDEFGDARLREVLAEVAHLDATAIAARLLSELRAWIQDATQYDDLTFIVMKVKA